MVYSYPAPISEEGKMPSEQVKNSHCSYCGARFTSVPWPRTCEECSRISYCNPMPVVVLLIPTEDGGLLLAERGIDPKMGHLALTSGFMELNETPAETGAREHKEETGIAIDPEELEWFDFSKKPDLLLIFLCLKRPLTKAEVASFVPTAEAVRAQVIYGPVPLAFASHTTMVAEYFATRGIMKPV